MQPDDHYVVITADSHAGGSHAQYREFLDPEVPRRLRRLAQQVQEPVQGPEGHQAPHPQLGPRAARPAAERRRHRRRGHLPQHRAAVLPELRALRRAAAPGGVRAPPRRACRRTTAGSPTTARRSPRPAPASARSSSTTSTTPSPTCSGARRTACAAACWWATRPVTADWLKPMYDPYYDPLWAVCEELGVVVNTHSGTGGPKYQMAPAMPLVHINEMIFYSQRPFVYMITGGVFERFPKHRVRAHRSRVRVGPPGARQPRRAHGHAAHRRRPARCASRARSCPPRTRPTTSSRTATSA